ncbi:MAG: DNA modification methylase [Gammaproteobacteria bacterium]
MEIILQPLDSIRPYGRNPRAITDAAVAKVTESIREFGFRQPIVVDGQRTIIAGHTRFLAAQRLGLTEVPVHIASNLTPAQAQAYRLADNRTNQEAKWDKDLLAAELLEISEMDFAMDSLGFDEEELSLLLTQAMLAEDGDAAEQVPDAPEHPVTQAGDIWQLGGHRLMCADATVKEHHDQLLNGVRPLLMVTDPPYGVSYDPAWRLKLGPAHGGVPIRNDHEGAWPEIWKLFAGDVVYVWHAMTWASRLHEALEAAGFELRNTIIWAKSNYAISQGHYHQQYEPCSYAVRKGRTAHWTGLRNQSTLWSIPYGDQDLKTPHATQKPLECMRRPMVNNSNPGQAVFDPFLGSGTTLIAAQQTGRVCYGFEIEPRFCDVIVLRWQNLTGETATRQSDGARLDAPAKEAALG